MLRTKLVAYLGNKHSTKGEILEKNRLIQTFLRPWTNRFAFLQLSYFQCLNWKAHENKTCCEVFCFQQQAAACVRFCYTCSSCQLLLAFTFLTHAACTFCFQFQKTGKTGVRLSFFGTTDFSFWGFTYIKLKFELDTTLTTVHNAQAYFGSFFRDHTPSVPNCRSFWQI